MFGILLIGIATCAVSKTGYCWKNIESRDSEIPTSCAPGKERNGLLCYDLCPSGMVGLGPVCWDQCQEGWSQFGPTCKQNGTLFVFQRRKSKKRGAGSPMQCSSQGKSAFNGGLCYNPCKKGSMGSGNKCIAKCEGSYPYDCGAGCAVTKSDCDITITAGAFMAIIPPVLITSLSTKPFCPLFSRGIVDPDFFNGDTDTDVDISWELSHPPSGTKPLVTSVSETRVDLSTPTIIHESNLPQQSNTIVSNVALPTILNPVGMDVASLATSDALALSTAMVYSTYLITSTQNMSTTTMVDPVSPSKPTPVSPSHKDNRNNTLHVKERCGNQTKIGEQVANRTDYRIVHESVPHSYLSSSVASVELSYLILLLNLVCV